MTSRHRFVGYVFAFCMIGIFMGACGLLPGPDPDPDKDTTAPTVGFTRPMAGTTVTETSLTLSADADDAGGVGVAEVRFFMGETSIGSVDTAAPYEATATLTAENNGEVSFRAVALDAAGNDAEATVRVMVLIDDPETNQPPVARGQTVSTTPNTPVAITLEAMDPDAGDTLVFDIDSEPTRGTITEVDPATNSVTYTPNEDFVAGSDSFVFGVADGEGLRDSATVTITMAGPIEGVWYVNNASDPGGDGRTPETAFDTLAAAQDAAGEGHTIFVFAGDSATTPYAGISLESGQQLIGEAAGLTVNGTVVVEPGGPRPIITSGPSGRGVYLTDVANVTIRGLEIAHTADSGIEGDYLAGDIVIEDVVITSPGTADQAVPANANTAGHSGIYLNHSAKTDTMDAFYIRDVTITDPARFGIWLDDPNTLIIEDGSDADSIGVTVTGLKDPAGLTTEPGYGGVGIDVQNEYGSQFTITDAVVDSPGADNVSGIRVIKNGYHPSCTDTAGATVSCDLNVDINGADINLSGAGTVGIRIEHKEDGPDGDDDPNCFEDAAKEVSCPDYDAAGVVYLSGAGNNVQAEQAFTLDAMPDGTDAGTDLDFGRLAGTVEINGTEYPTPDMTPIEAGPGGSSRQ